MVAAGSGRRGDPGSSALVEHDGLGILVCHLRHVTQDVLFCDDSKQAPAGERGQQRDRERHTQTQRGGRG